MKAIVAAIAISSFLIANHLFTEQCHNASQWLFIDIMSIDVCVCYAGYFGKHQHICSYSVSRGTMASSGSDDPSDRNNLPNTPKMVLKDDGTASEELRPDTVENVERQTYDIFRQFVHWMYTLYRNRQGHDADDTPSLPEITTFNENPLA